MRILSVLLFGATTIDTNLSPYVGFYAHRWKFEIKTRDTGVVPSFSFLSQFSLCLLKFVDNIKKLRTTGCNRKNNGLFEFLKLYTFWIIFSA